MKQARVFIFLTLACLLIAYCLFTLPHGFSSPYSFRNFSSERICFVSPSATIRLSSIPIVRGDQHRDR